MARGPQGCRKKGIAMYSNVIYGNIHYTNHSPLLSGAWVLQCDIWESVGDEDRQDLADCVLEELRGSAMTPTEEVHRVLRLQEDCSEAGDTCACCQEPGGSTPICPLFKKYGYQVVIFGSRAGD
jgi:hypothetical protein